MCCSMLQCVAVYFHTSDMLPIPGNMGNKNTAGSVLRCVAVCCSMLLCVFTRETRYLFQVTWEHEDGTTDITIAEPIARLEVCCRCCSVLQCVAVCRSVSQCVTVCCSVLQCVVVCCSVLQCVVVCCSVLQCLAVSFPYQPSVKLCAI